MSGLLDRLCRGRTATSRAFEARICSRTCNREPSLLPFELDQCLGNGGVPKGRGFKPHLAPSGWWRVHCHRGRFGCGALGAGWQQKQHARVHCSARLPVGLSANGPGSCAGCAGAAIHPGWLTAGAAYPPPSTLSLTPASHHYLHQRYVLLNPHHWQAWGVSHDVVYCRAVVQLHPADG
jgi:hypothetical protein